MDYTSVKSFFATLTVQKLVPAIVILVVGLIAVRMLTKLFGKALSRSKMDSSLHSILFSVFKILLYAVLALIVAGSLGFDMSSLIAMLSVLSLAISLAVQGALSNVAGGVQILSAHPFHEGDFVEISGTSGTVEATGLVYTTLVTIDGKRIMLPNSDVAAGKVVNYTSLGRRRVDLKFSASYDAAPERVIAALTRAATVPEALPGEEIFVRTASYDDSAIAYDVRIWCATADYWTVYYKVTENVYREFARDHIEMTYPHMNVHIQS